MEDEDEESDDRYVVIVAGVVCASPGTVQINKNATRVVTIETRSGTATAEEEISGQ